MLSLGFISFATPWALAAAAALPLVWLLLRLTPPSVRQINFPAIRLLFGLDPTKRSAAHTPPWLLILRVAILALALLGLADPILNMRQSQGSGPLIVVVDNGWAAATSWEDRVNVMRDLLESADRRGQPAVLVTTAAQPAGATPETLAMQPARDVLARALQTAPQPWPTDRAAAAERLRALKVSGAQSTWIADGVDGPGAAALVDDARCYHGVTPVEPENPAHPAYRDVLVVTFKKKP